MYWGYDGHITNDDLAELNLHHRNGKKIQWSHVKTGCGAYTFLLIDYHDPVGSEISRSPCRICASLTDCTVSGRRTPIAKVLPGDVMHEADGPEDKGPLDSHWWYRPWYTLCVHECWRLTIRFWLAPRWRGTDTVGHAWKAVAGHRWNEPARACMNHC